MVSKAEAVAQLEVQVATLNASLESSLTDAAAKHSEFETLEKEKQASETKLKELQSELEGLRAQHQDEGLVLEAVQQEVSHFLSLSHRLLIQKCMFVSLRLRKLRLLHRTNSFKAFKSKSRAWKSKSLPLNPTSKP